jgi:hypothetical protein
MHVLSSSLMYMRSRKSRRIHIIFSFAARKSHQYYPSRPPKNCAFKFLVLIGSWVFVCHTSVVLCKGLQMYQSEWLTISQRACLHTQLPSFHTILDSDEFSYRAFFLSFFLSHHGRSLLLFFCQILTQERGDREQSMVLTRSHAYYQDATAPGHLTLESPSAPFGRRFHSFNFLCF